MHYGPIPSMRFIFFSLLVIGFGSEVMAQKYTAQVPDIRKTTLWDVAFTDSLHGVAVGDYGVLLRTIDGGKSWDAKKSKTQMAFRNVHFFNAEEGIAAGFWSTLYRTTDSGASWEMIHLHSKSHLPGMAASGNRTWLSGDSGIVLRSDDRGKSWIRIPMNTKLMIDAIAFSDSLNGWCSSEHGLMMRSTDGGLSWTMIKPPSKMPITSIAALSKDTCWVAGFNGLIASTFDGGLTWTTHPSFQTHYSRIRFDPHGCGWAVGRLGSIVRMNRQTGEWALDHALQTGAMNSICFLPDDSVVAVGSDGVIERFRVK